jgi:hypothetical protein
VIARLAELRAVDREDVVTTVEKMVFKLPRQLVE